MNSDSKTELNYFVNKPITVITRGINRNFNETQSIDYFTGICERITSDGLVTRHPITNCKNFFVLSSVVGIFEEQQLDPENPEHAYLIKEIKDKKVNEHKINEQKINEQISLKDKNNELNIESLNSLLDRN